MRYFKLDVYRNLQNLTSGKDWYFSVIIPALTVKPNNKFATINLSIVQYHVQRWFSSHRTNNEKYSCRRKFIGKRYERDQNTAAWKSARNGTRTDKSIEGKLNIISERVWTGVAKDKTVIVESPPSSGATGWEFIFQSSLFVGCVLHLLRSLIPLLDNITFHRTPFC